MDKVVINNDLIGSYWTKTHKVTLGFLELRKETANIPRKKEFTGPYYDTQQNRSNNTRIIFQLS